MQYSSLTELAEAYLEHARIGSKAESSPAFDAACDLEFQERWEDLWEMILAIATRDELIETDALCFVAAGPLENLISRAGPQFIDRIEQTAKFNRQFARMLTGVWKSDTDPAVWERIVRFCRAFPDPVDVPYQY